MDESTDTPQPEVAPEPVEAPAPDPVEAPVETEAPEEPEVPEEPEHEKAVEGHFVKVVDGPHKGVVGAFLKHVGNGHILVRARDHAGPVDLITVLFKHCRPKR